ncbi:MAG TPA: patatin-like phospholipase family protein [Conexibacter sp.]|nr:patatin-like phospholipase family protein [Conexibacter sp.]
MTGGAGSADGPVGLVLAGGGARGAYELGALSALLPALEARGERPRVIVGTSVGALNAAFLAGTAERPVEEVVARGLEIWESLRFEHVLAHLGSPGAVRRLWRYVGQFLGVPGARLDALLDPAPLQGTLTSIVPLAGIERNVAVGALHAAAFVATSALTSRSVVFHRGGGAPARDDKRGIDYVDVGTDGLSDEHVRASSAIPGAFPAVHVDAPQRARGWYVDGGTRLNTPVKPALELGAQRVVVVALNAIGAPAGGEADTDRPLAGEHRPDAIEGAAQLLQAVLVDPLANDVATLATVNALVGAAADEQAAGKQQVPYIFVAPQERDAIGRLAQRVFDEHFADLRDAWRARDLAFLGRAVAGGSDAAHGELLSYLFFAPQFARELIALGRADAERWLAASHEDGPWEIGPAGVQRGA